MSLSDDSLKRYASGDTVPKLDVASAIACAAGRSLDWLAYGEDHAAAKAADGREFQGQYAAREDAAGGLDMGALTTAVAVVLAAAVAPSDANADALAGRVADVYLVLQRAGADKNVSDAIRRLLE